jgi:hypothetical protein
MSIVPPGVKNFQKPLVKDFTTRQRLARFRWKDRVNRGQWSSPQAIFELRREAIS